MPSVVIRSGILCQYCQFLLFPYLLNILKITHQKMLLQGRKSLHVTKCRTEIVVGLSFPPAFLVDHLRGFLFPQDAPWIKDAVRKSVWESQGIVFLRDLLCIVRMKALGSPAVKVLPLFSVVNWILLVIRSKIIGLIFIWASSVTMYLFYFVIAISIPKTAQPCVHIPHIS